MVAKHPATSVQLDQYCILIIAGQQHEVLDLFSQSRQHPVTAGSSDVSIRLWCTMNLLQSHSIVTLVLCLACCLRQPTQSPCLISILITPTKLSPLVWLHLSALRSSAFPRTATMDRSYVRTSSLARKFFEDFPTAKELPLLLPPEQQAAFELYVLPLLQLTDTSTDACIKSVEQLLPVFGGAGGFETYSSARAAADYVQSPLVSTLPGAHCICGTQILHRYSRCEDSNAVEWCPTQCCMYMHTHGASWLCCVGTFLAFLSKL